MANTQKNMWWGYKHISGTYQAKRYFPEEKNKRAAIDDAYSSDFVEDVVEPFEANDRDEALSIVKQRTA